MPAANFNRWDYLFDEQYSLIFALGMTNMGVALPNRITPPGYNRSVVIYDQAAAGAVPVNQFWGTDYIECLRAFLLENASNDYSSFSVATRVGVDMIIYPMDFESAFNSGWLGATGSWTKAQIFNSRMADSALTPQRLIFEEGTAVDATPPESDPNLRWSNEQFPETPYNSMRFFDGRSFYIPNGTQVSNVLTRAFQKTLGQEGTLMFLVVVSTVDPLGIWWRVAIPCRYAVAYGKWDAYPVPDFELAKSKQKLGPQGKVTQGITVNEVATSLEDLMRIGRDMEVVDSLNVLKTLITSTV